MFRGSIGRSNALPKPGMTALEKWRYADRARDIITPQPVMAGILLFTGLGAEWAAVNTRISINHGRKNQPEFLEPGIGISHKTLHLLFQVFAGASGPDFNVRITEEDGFSRTIYAYN